MAVVTAAVFSVHGRHTALVLRSAVDSLTLSGAVG